METNSPRGGALAPDLPDPSKVEPAAPPDYTPQPHPIPDYGPPMTTPGMAPHYPPYPTPYPYGYGYNPMPRRSRGGRGWLIGGIITLIVLALFAALIVGGILFAVNLGGSTYSATNSSTFAVTGAPIVNVYNTAGSVTIRQGNVGQVVVQITNNIRSIDSNGAQRELITTAITPTQSGNTITVNGHFATRWQDGSWYNRTVGITLTLPANAAPTVQVAAGSIDVSGITGAFNLQTNAGTITTNNVTFADGSSVSTNAGAINVNGAITPGADLRVTDNAGSVSLRLPADTPARLDASVNVGSISITGWQIAVSRANTVGASANGALGSNPTGTLHVTVNAGNLSLIAQ